MIAAPAEQPVWLLWSERRLPPMKNRFVHEDGTEHLPGDTATRNVDDPFFPPLYRYDRSAVEALGAVDVLLTQEAFGWTYTVPMLIVSQRFRQWCRKQKLRCEWVPIALE